jgi:hypothetical protein
MRLKDTGESGGAAFVRTLSGMAKELLGGVNVSEIGEKVDAGPGAKNIRNQAADPPVQSNETRLCGVVASPAGGSHTIA